MRLTERFLKFSLALFFTLFTCEAAFAAGYTLTVGTTGSGVVTRNPTNSVYPSGATVTLTAVPDSAWLFSSWSGDETGTVNPLNVLMTSNKNVVAHFDLIPSYTVTTSVNGSGTVSLNPSAGPYLSNTVVSASATPSSGWVFLNWSGDATGTTSPTSITMNTNKTVAAVFAQIAAITVPPQNLSIGLSQSATFTVQAVGTGPLRFQWYFAGIALTAETTSVLNISSAQSENEGIYGIVVTNLYGSSSNFALLTITNACSGANVVHSPNEAELRNAIAIGGLVRCCFNGTVVLTNTIDITHDVILDAQDRSVTISGNDAVRLFNVHPGVTFSATNVAFVHGKQAGQNGAAAGTQQAQPGQPAEGGAIYCSGGTVKLIQCVLATNSVVGGTGGTGTQTLPHGAAGGQARGGAIFLTNGSLSIFEGIMCSNSAAGGSGGAPQPAPPQIAGGQGGDALGGAIYVTNGIVIIINGVITNNLCYAPKGYDSGALAVGGAIAAASCSTLITNTLVCSNTAVGQDGQILLGYIYPVPFPGAGLGGAMAVLGGEANLSLCRFEGNASLAGYFGRDVIAVSAKGGGIYTTGNLSAEESSFVRNRAVCGAGTDIACGGGLFSAGRLTLNRCSVAANRVAGANYGYVGSNHYTGGKDGRGGGIYSSSGLNATNCTISGNVAAGGDAPGGGVYVEGPGGVGIGGGLFSTNETSWLFNTTVAQNAVMTGLTWAYGAITNPPSLGANIAVTNGTVSLLNSIVAYPGTNANVWGALLDAGYNICSDGSATFQSGSSFNFTDPLLLPLANNGGPTSTMALSPDSPAVDFGSSAGAPSTDQRGLTRPMGAGVDIGAYELSGPLTGPQLSLSVQGAGSLALSFAAQPNVFYLLQGSNSLQTWNDLEALGPFSQATNVIYSIPVAARGNEYFRLTVR